MSDTPRTNAFIGDQTEVVLTEGEQAMCEFARTLEREITALKEQLAKMNSSLQKRINRINEPRKIYRDALRHIANEVVLDAGNTKTLKRVINVAKNALLAKDEQPTEEKPCNQS